MNTIDFQCCVEAEAIDGGRRVIAERCYSQQPVMKIGAVRTWVRKAYNKALREADHNVIVSASYHGQEKRSPYNYYTGFLSGVNGRTMRQTGGFEE